MKIGISLETTKVLRNTWHSVINHEWYHVMAGHEIHPLICHDKYDASNYDLIILCGGNDMPGMPTWRDNNYPIRDEFEGKLLQDAINKNIPVVGICRGSHFMNWALGGTLRFLPEPYDNVEVELENLTVTCHHTIAIDKLAPGFEVLKQDSSGVIELAIDRNRRLLGVGWHPERNVNAHTRDMIKDLIKDL